MTLRYGKKEKNGQVCDSYARYGKKLRGWRGKIDKRQ